MRFIEAGMVPIAVLSKAINRAEFGPNLDPFMCGWHTFVSDGLDPDPYFGVTRWEPLTWTFIRPVYTHKIMPVCLH